MADRSRAYPTSVICRPSTSIDEGLRMLQACGADILVIIHAGHPVGVLTEQELVSAREQQHFHAQDPVRLVLTSGAPNRWLERSP